MPPSEPYRIVLQDLRERLWATRDYYQQMMSQGKSDIPAAAILTSTEEVREAAT